MVNSNQRKAAIDWLNSSTKDYNTGIAILEEAGYKPGVVARLKTLGLKASSMMHLVENMRLYIQFCGKEVEDTDADLGVFNGALAPEMKQKDDNGTKTIERLAAELESEGQNVPAVIRYAKMYREREKCHRQLKDCGEGNAPDCIAKRKELTAQIAKLTTCMEKIYPHVESFLKDGTIATEEDVEAVLADTETEESPEPSETAADNMTAEELRKQIKSVKTKILRKNNLLLYQQETKADKENPLPDCPKRVKYETEIAKLEKELEALQYALARKA